MGGFGSAGRRQTRRICDKNKKLNTFFATMDILVVVVAVPWDMIRQNEILTGKKISTYFFGQCHFFGGFGSDEASKILTGPNLRREQVATRDFFHRKPEFGTRINSFVTSVKFCPLGGRWIVLQ